MSFSVTRVDALEYLSSSLLSDAPHCFSTRCGGVSRAELASLNLGIHRGDEPERVWENYRVLGRALGFTPEQTVFTQQIHSDIIDCVTQADCGRGLLRPVGHGCDGLVTNFPGVVLTVFTADCTPVLLYDPVARAIGAVHAGWRGTALAITARAVERMGKEFGSRPEDIRAAVGPCISRCCFETDGDVPEAMRAAFGREAEDCMEQCGEKYHVDLKALNALALRRAGVRQIDIASDCTACQPARFWSHRRVGARRGSLAAMIFLRGDAR